MKRKGYIPNFFTSVNLICGCLGIIEVFEGRLVNVPYYIWISGLVDFLDGFSARLIGSNSVIGKDLDSLADLVSFGVLPSLVGYSLLREYSDMTFLPYLAILIAVFSALRLAKFNNDERQSNCFYGLPTPANALVFSSLPLLIQEKLFASLLTDPYFLSTVVIAFSFLLISEIRLMAFKFKNYTWQGNEAKFIFLGLSLVLVTLYQHLAIPFIVVLYVLVSILNNFITSPQDE